MKKAFVLILSVFPMIASGDYLDDKIADLTKQKLEKIAELEECQKSSKGLKIAGITTLGVSTVGIAANIGEAVALKKLDGQISEAETKLGDLDEQIKDKKDENERKEQQANTCGVQQCNVAERTEKMATLNAKDVVCVNGAWVPSACNDGFSGATATCTLNSTTVTYYMSCKQDAKTCEKITDEWLNQNNAKSGECDTTTGEKYIKECKDGFTGTKRTSGNRDGYKMCQKKEGGKKQDNKSGEKSGGGDATTTIKDCPRAMPVSYVLKDCKAVCNQYATQNSCKIKEVYEGAAGCICNPDDADADRGNLLKGLLEKKCPEITEAWKSAQHALSAECDSATGRIYIKECRHGYTPEKDTYGRIEKCVNYTYISKDGVMCKTMEFTVSTFQTCDMICKNYARNTGCQIKDHAEDKGTGKCICNPNK